jgi:tetratricopeptide (TPR) repeat protein
VAEFSYRAYISYSHQDEAWAAWLHRALESYRVPAKIVGKKTAAGVVPARIRPVFRDRDDLSSATDLKETVKQALVTSQNLIVLCSPAAAASRWVNEEIRLFAKHVDKDRIFCVIVAGDAASGDVPACFPAALAETGLVEPLAADARRWADGRHLAKLKVVAGLLGLRLDELRQRDLKRRRQRRLIAALGAVAALVLIGTTVISKISQQHQREKAEQLASFIVDLGERLRSDVDLETLAVINAEALAHLEDLDPEDLSPETGKRVALSLRQMGRISQAQGRPEEALQAFRQSHDVLSRQYQAHPELTELLFELGNAEYYIGNLHYEQGRHQAGLRAMQNYYQSAQKLFDSDPDNPDWILELASAHVNLAALQLDSVHGFGQQTLTHVNRAIELQEQLLKLQPDDKDVRNSYANIIAWAADAQFQACNLDEALRMRIEARDFAGQSMHLDPGDNDLQRNYAYKLTGVARIRIAKGNMETDAGDLRHAINVLQQLSASDPSNMVYKNEALYRQVMLAKWLADTGRLEAARALLQEVGPGILATATGESTKNLQETIEFLLTRASVEHQLGNAESAQRDLEMILRLQGADSSSWPADFFAAQRLARLKYQWWQINGLNDFDRFPAAPGLSENDGRGLRSCIEADAAARIHVIDGNREAAAKDIEYLRSRGYAEPGFMRFCRENGLCET